MEKRSIEAAVGIFVILGMICVGYLTIKLGKMQVLGDNTYSLSARLSPYQVSRPVPMWRWQVSRSAKSLP